MKQFKVMFLSGLFLFCLQVFPYASPLSFTNSGPVTVTSSSAIALAGNGKRGYLLIVNTGANTAYLKFGSVQSGTEGIPLIAGGVYEPVNYPANPLYAVTASSTTTLVFVQGQ